MPAFHPVRRSGRRREGVLDVLLVVVVLVLFLGLVGLAHWFQRI